MPAKIHLLVMLCSCCMTTQAQMLLSKTGVNNKTGVTVKQTADELTVDWPGGAGVKGRLVINLINDKPLFSSIQFIKGTKPTTVIFL